MEEYKKGSGADSWIPVQGEDTRAREKSTAEDAGTEFDFFGFDTYVTISFEHFGDDLGIIRTLPAGANFIFSVPNFDHDEHYNIFASPEAGGVMTC